ncbi:MAG TPA: histone [archaeon]|nr:histone [archaeon]
MAKKRALPMAAVERLVKKAGADRVSPDAILALEHLLSEIAEDIARRSVRYMKYAKRNTLQRADIEIAASE